MLLFFRPETAETAGACAVAWPKFFDNGACPQIQPIQARAYLPQQPSVRAKTHKHVEQTGSRACRYGQSTHHRLAGEDREKQMLFSVLARFFISQGETPKSLLGSSVTLLLSLVLATTAVRLNRKRCERRTLLASPVCPAIPKPSHLPATTAECCRGVCGLLSKHTTQN